MDSHDLIREGFICPECREDLTSFNLLQAHFELKHSNQSAHSDEKASNNSLSSVFAKAKNLIINQNTSSNDQTQQAASASTILNEKYESSLPPQENGVFHSHTKDFKEHRDKTIGRYVIQTNKLLIILDKLISNDTIKDENKRKAFEMSIVPWVPDSDVNLCPTCARSFGILHRKHHCRLCGAIMCNRCSQFLSTTAAKQLTDPSMFLKDSELKFKRSNSNTSINSHQIYENNDNNNNQNEIYLRLCVDCSRLLNKKYQTMKDKANKPKIFSLYDDFYSCMKESEKLYPVYSKMAQSLGCGETVHSLKSAEDMRLKLIQLFQKIDLLSNTILNYGIQKTPANDKTTNTQQTLTSTVSRDQLKLQKNIRLYAINYLKEYSFQLPILPSKEEYEKLVEQKRKYLLEEMQRETLEKLKLLELDAKRQQKSNTSNNAAVASTNATHMINNADGWVPSTKLINNSKSSNDDSDDINDPIRIQIKVVESYLDEALRQNRTEEIEMLENNLRELKSILNDNN